MIKKIIFDSEKGKDKIKESKEKERYLQQKLYCRKQYYFNDIV